MITNKSLKYPIKNTLNKKYGSLTVINYTDKRDKFHRVIWECRCDCGNIVYENSWILRHRQPQHLHCGCLYSKGILNKGNPKGAYKSYFYASRKKYGKFEISFEDFINLVKKDCYYCGAKPSHVVSDKGTIPFICNGLDRVNNDRGYTLDNIVPCCKTCNIAKHAMTQKDFLDWIKRVYKHSKKAGLFDENI